MGICTSLAALVGHPAQDFFQKLPHPEAVSQFRAVCSFLAGMNNHAFFITVPGRILPLSVNANLSGEITDMLMNFLHFGHEKTGYDLL